MSRLIVFLHGFCERFNIAIAEIDDAVAIIDQVLDERATFKIAGSIDYIGDFMSFFVEEPLSIGGEFSFPFYNAVCRELETYFNAPIFIVGAFANYVKLCICSARVLADAWDRGV